MTHVVGHGKNSSRRTKVKRAKFSLRLPKEMKRALAALAAREEEASVGTIARRAIREFLEKQELLEATAPQRRREASTPIPIEVGAP